MIINFIYSKIYFNLMENYEIVIVGAGPAGLKCAEILAKNNKKVLVLEKNKIIGDKVCAGGLTLRDLELGIPDKIIQRKFKKIIKRKYSFFLKRIQFN